MKKNAWLFLIFIVLVVNSVTGQVEGPAIGQIENSASGQDKYRQLYKSKVITYTKMHRGGLVMTGFGAGSTIAGIALLASIPSEYWDTNNGYYTIPNQDKYDLQAAEGVIFLGIGIGLLAGGITLSSIGGYKVRSYRHKLDNLSMGVICAPNRQGLSLTYRF
jgi:hypothetical protein